MTVIIVTKTMMLNIVDNKREQEEKMGVPKEVASRNRQAIIETAARVFRERGVDGVGVADLMKEAGFTHGGFYNHFESKDALAAEACASAFANGAAHMKDLVADSGGDRDVALRALVDGYLSGEQCALPGNACPTGTMAVDAARHGKQMQAAYAAGILEMVEVLTTRVFTGDPDARGEAITMLASLVGHIVIARGVSAVDPDLAREVLAAGRAHLGRAE
jgi:TetR/AcrR family transcriptional repressor of nem operon